MSTTKPTIRPLKEMKFRLAKEQKYFAQVKPGQCFKIIQDITNLTTFGYPEIAAGEILMFIRWVVKETIETVGDCFTSSIFHSFDPKEKVTGPLRLLRGRVHMRRIDIDKLKMIDSAD